MNSPLLMSQNPSLLDKETEVTRSRNGALVRFAVEDIQRLRPSEVEELQALLQHGSELGIWKTPLHWLPPGKQAPHRYATDLRRRILQYLPKNADYAGPDFEKALGHAVLSLSRYLILLRMGPAGLGRRGWNRSLDVTSITGVAHSQGPALYALALAQRFQGSGVVESQDSHDEPSILAFVSSLDSPQLTTALRKEVLNECERLRMLAERQLWDDVPSFSTSSRVAALKGPPLNNAPPKERDVHLPFPDDYLAEMGRKSLWLMHNVGPNILLIAKEMVELWIDSEQRGWAWPTVVTYRQTRTKELLSAHVWKDEKGNVLDALPFEVRFPKEYGFGAGRPRAGRGERAGSVGWMPKNYRDVKTLLGAVQMAHYFVIAISMGARASETLSMKRSCVVYASDGHTYASGRTFKLVQSFEGEERDWLLPDVAVKAIEQQIGLVRLAEQLSDVGQRKKRREPAREQSGMTGQYLWAGISSATASDSSQSLRNINAYLQTYARTLGMSVKPGGQNIRSHRFRKTLARLVALALTQAPKILMDIFGHKSIEMTLYYILTDKDLRGEVETVTRELRVMRAKEVVERLVEAQLQPQTQPALGGYGGLAAITIDSAVQARRNRVHRRGEDWSASHTYELAELLTMQGTAWEQVRPGVLCTKFPGEAGPCNKSKGRPEPSKCESVCGHRLEEAFLREDVDACIQDCVANYERALSEDEQLLAAHWAAQVRAHVVRFADIKEKWMQSATVAALLNIGCEARSL